jgi:D-beta-D-heptose 7-phosphate kinase/D-beta-D-heptose 1-phosphate adenosyltransferase
MNDIDLKRMKKIIQNFKNEKILVLGDIMLDKYIWGHVSRISPEAPVPVIEVKGDTSCLGGAGNVSYNLASLGAKSLLVGVVGNDSEGTWIKKSLPNDQGIFLDENRPTIVKTRIIAHQQQVVRVDKEERRAISSQMEDQIFNLIQKEKCNALLISDYNKGTITQALMKKVLDFAQKNGIPVFVDPKVENFFLFSPVTLITPNHIEAEKIIHHECLTDIQVEKAGEAILTQISSQYIIIKRGEKGMTVLEKGKKPLHIPTIAKEVYDVTGAGDTVIATATLGLLSGGTIREAAILAAAASGIVVGKIGTATVTPGELLDGIVNR